MVSSQWLCLRSIGHQGRPQHFSKTLKGQRSLDKSLKTNNDEDNCVVVSKSMDRHHKWKGVTRFMSTKVS